MLKLDEGALVALVPIPKWTIIKHAPAETVECAPRMAAEKVAVLDVNPSLY